MGNYVPPPAPPSIPPEHPLLQVVATRRIPFRSAFGESFPEWVPDSSSLPSSRVQRAIALREHFGLSALTPHSPAESHGSGGRASGSYQQGQMLSPFSLGARKRKGGGAAQGGALSRVAQRSRCYFPRCPTLDKVPGARCLKLDKALGAFCPTLDKVQGAFCPTLDTTSRSPARRGALGRRGREADPDSRSASERGGSAKREKPREQGRRHLVVN